MKESVAETKSFAFAKDIVEMCQYLQEHKKEYIMSKQLLRSGTSIGANVAEAEYAYSKPDFYAKICIALKEASETRYWLRLIKATGYITSKTEKSNFQTTYDACEELIRILAAISKSKN